MWFCFLAEQHANCGHNQKRGENIQRPFKFPDERGSKPDHRAAEYQRSQNSPEQDTMLVATLNAEGAEHEDENENVVHAERLFDQVASEKLKGFFAFVGVKDPEIEAERESHPNYAQEGGFAHGDGTRVAMKHAEVEHEQEKNSCVKNNPKGWSAHRVRDRKSTRLNSSHLGISYAVFC